MIKASRSVRLSLLALGLLLISGCSTAELVNDFVDVDVPVPPPQGRQWLTCRRQNTTIDAREVGGKPEVLRVRRVNVALPATLPPRYAALTRHRSAQFHFRVDSLPTVPSPGATLEIDLTGDECNFVPGRDSLTVYRLGASSSQHVAIVTVPSSQRIIRVTGLLQFSGFAIAE